MSKYTSLTSINALYRWATYLCGKVGMTVEFFTPEPGKQPYATEDGIHIPACVSMTEEAEQNLRFYVLHECAHLGIGPDIFRLYKEKLGGAQHPIGIISNIIEDWRIEYVSARGFKGDRQVIDTGRCNMLRVEHEILERAKATGHRFDDDTARFAAIGGMSKLVMAEYLPTFNVEFPPHLEAFPPECVTHCNILTGNNFRDRLYALTCEVDTWALSEDVYCWLWDKTKEQAQLEQEQAKQEAGDGETGKAGKASKGDDSDSAEGESDITDNKDGTVTVNWRVFSASDHTKHKGEGSPVRIDFGDCPTTSEWQPYPVDQVKVSKAEERSVPDRYRRITTSPTLRNKVRQWLQAKAAVAYDTGHKSGSLRAGSLWRGGVPAVGAAEWNQRVFKRPAADTDMDSAVLILVDFSGSMSGEKISTAAVATSALTDVLKCVSVPCAVLGFTDHTSCQVFTFKEFSESVAPDKLLGRFAWAEGEMAGNSDADAVLFAHHYLTNNINAARKALIVLSDGCPTDCYIPDYARSTASAMQMAHSGLLKVTKELQDSFITGKSNVELIGVGILDSSVKNYYKTHVVLSDVKALESTLLGIVKRSIL